MAGEAMVTTADHTRLMLSVSRLHLLRLLKYILWLAENFAMKITLFWMHSTFLTTFQSRAAENSFSAEPEQDSAVGMAASLPQQ